MKVTRKIKVLSLFDGISCGMLALNSVGIDVDRYVAYEIDKYAIETSKHNFPQIEHKGNVFDGNFKEYENFDVLIGGSPCTYWSIAQKNNRETEASGKGWELFQQYIRALKESKPKFFLYENNKSMSKAIRRSIDEAFGFEATLINSSLVSAQNRQRLYWVGKRNNDGTYSKVSIPQPKDKGILLRDILENGVYISSPVNVTANGKSQTIKSQYNNTSVVNICCYSSTYGASGVAEIARVGSLPNNDCEDKTIYPVKDGHITIKGKKYPIKLSDGYYIIRKLTVRECMRLQNIPEWFEFPVSNTQAYKQIGNGWTVDVIAHILIVVVEALR